MELFKRGYALRKRKTRMLTEYWELIQKRLLKIKDKDPITYIRYQGELLSTMGQ